MPLTTKPSQYAWWMQINFPQKRKRSKLPMPELTHEISVTKGRQRLCILRGKFTAPVYKFIFRCTARRILLVAWDVRIIFRKGTLTSENPVIYSLFASSSSFTVPLLSGNAYKGLVIFYACISNLRSWSGWGALGNGS